MKVEAVRYLGDNAGQEQDGVNDQGDDAQDAKDTHGQIFLGRSFCLVHKHFKGHSLFLLFVILFPTGKPVVKSVRE